VHSGPGRRLWQGRAYRHVASAHCYRAPAFTFIFIYDDDDGDAYVTPADQRTCPALAFTFIYDDADDDDDADAGGCFLAPGRRR
jgi:hypothetical protein